MKKILILATALMFNNGAMGAVFGTDMGTSLSSLNKQLKLKAESQYLYSTSTLPKGHPDFDNYWLLVTSKHGLCKVTAYIDRVNTNVYGEELILKFGNLETALSSKYGNGKKFDYLRAGSIWNERRDWMMGLLKKDRTLVTYWTKNELELPADIAAISLQADARGSDMGSITLSYEFNNSSECVEWIKQQKNSNL